MPTLGWESQTAKDSEKDEQPPQKGKDQDEKALPAADASPKSNETAVKAEERLAEPNKVPFDAGRLNVRVVGDLRGIK
ncbi:hypothetical protein C0993_005114 [Termitomyces sp. T159_Od127]|nr:hypothetical protein C0993_005114 [Termitomyces sp. T159_Od127]